MLNIRPASVAEFQNVRMFYHTLIDMMQDAEYKPRWEKEIYPSSEYLFASIRNQTLWIGEWDGEIAAAMIVNHDSNEGYRKAKWSVDVAEHEITVIHALGVLPVYGGKGFAKAMVNKAIALAQADQQKAIRLDVLAGNLPAERLYIDLGFQFRETVTMFYEDTGWTDFLLYEYPL